MAQSEENERAAHGASMLERATKQIPEPEQDTEDENAYRLLPTKKELTRWTGYVIFGAVLYACGYFCLGDFVLPGGKVFPLLLIFVCAHVLGYLITKLRMPALLGMLLAGVILVNIPGGVVASVDKKWLKEIKYGSLAVIFLRSGLEQDLTIFKRVGPVAVRLLLVPGIVEALVSGGVGIPVFGLPVMLAFAMGFILKPVDPAIAMTMMFNLQAQNKGIRKGIPPLVVAAGSFDDLVAITLYTLCISFALPPAPGQSQVYQILKGPLNIVLGVVLGMVGALICAATKIWNTRLFRTLIVLFMALTQMYIAVKYDFSGAGVLSSIMLGVLVNWLWIKGWPGFLSSGPNPHYGTAVEHHVANFWDWLAQPMLFGLVGTAVDFHYITGSTIPKSLLVICSGWFARMPATFFAVMGANLTWKERLFVTLTWLPKATVQAALALSPLDAITEQGLGPEWVQWGEDIMVTALFAVLLCGPIGVIATTLGMKYLVDPDPPAEVSKSHATTVSAGHAEDGVALSLPSFVEEVEEDELERARDEYEDQVMVANDAKAGRMLMLLEKDIDELEDLCTKDSEQVTILGNMSGYLRELRRHLLEREVPHAGQVHGARDFVNRTRLSFTLAGPYVSGLGVRHRSAHQKRSMLELQ